MSKIGSYLKEYREQKKWSLRDLSKLSGVSHVHISDIEAGKNIPSLEIIVKLIKALGVGPEKFFTEIGILQRKPDYPTSGIVREDFVQYPDVAESTPFPSIENVRYVPIISWEDIDKYPDMAESTRFPSNEKDWILTGLDVFVFGLRVKDDTMEPAFFKDDIIMIEPVAETKPEDFMIIKNENSRDIVLIQLKKIANTFLFHFQNSKYSDIPLKRGYKGYKLFKDMEGNQYRVIGRVIKKEKFY
jgi:transcriptional regulator with XRE-family HTH domain